MTAATSTAWTDETDCIANTYLPRKGNHMKISELINELQGEMEIHGDLPLLRYDQYGYEDERHRVNANVTIEAINADRNVEEEESDAYQALADAEEALATANDYLKDAKEIVAGFNSTDCAESREEAIQEVVDYSVEVADAKEELTKAQKEVRRVEGLDSDPTHYVIN